MRKVLFSAWGGNGGVDDVVKSLQEGLARLNIGSDLIYHSRDWENANDPGPVELISDGQNRWYPGFSDFLRSQDWEKYAVIDLHSCNFRDVELEQLRTAAEHAPIIYQAHGIIPHAAYVEYMEGNRPDCVEYRNWLNTLLPDDKTRNIREVFTGWPVCKDQEALFDKAVKLVFLTKFTRDRFRFFYPGVSKGDEREIIIPNGSDIGKYANNHDVDREAYGIRQSIGPYSKIIMFSGRITPPKGASDLAKAFDRIRQTYPDAKLMLVGEPHDDYGGLSCVYDFIRPEFRQDVVTRGWISDKKTLAAHYKAADVLAIPSHHETFSISALEGMFMGTPVVLGDVDGSHEVYVEPQLAYGTSPEDTTRMCDLFSYLFEDPERSRSNAKHVQSVVNNNYSLDRVVDMTIGMYRGAIIENCIRTAGNYVVSGDLESARRISDKAHDSISQ